MLLFFVPIDDKIAPYSSSHTIQCLIHHILIIKQPVQKNKLIDQSIYTIKLTVCSSFVITAKSACSLAHSFLASYHDIVLDEAR